MFSGIIEKTVKISTANRSGDASIILVNTGYKDLVLGESIAVNGVCLTVSEISKEGLATFFVSPETMSKTSLAFLNEGGLINLERALQVGQRISGHIVQGHVDGLAKCTHLEKQSGAYLLRFEIPELLSRYTVEKGSIALDGVSLTINQIIENQIQIMLIPHTWSHTRFTDIKVGDWVNVEVDVIAKYTERLCQPYNKPLNS